MTAVLAALYEYGAPPTMEALSSLLEKKAEERGLLHYMATVGWSIGNALYKGNYMPTFTDMKKGTTQNVDNRSGAEIVADIVTKLKKRKEDLL